MPAKLIILNVDVQLDLHLRPNRQHTTLTIVQRAGKKNVGFFSEYKGAVT